MKIDFEGRLRRQPARYVLSAILAAGALFAQIGASGQVPASSLRTVIVAEFANRSGGALFDPGLPRVATDAVAVELAQSNKYEVVRRQEVEKAAETLGYRPPYDEVELSKLASSLSASDIVMGEIVGVQVTQPKGKPRTVKVGLRVSLLDASRRDVVNGAAVIGSYSERDDAESDEAMARQAVQRAAFEAVQQIVSNTLPEGIILNTVGGGTSGLKILVNRGSRDGLRIGQKMAVYRGIERLGVIRITDVSGDYSDAEPVVYSLGYRPMDRVRAIFTVPELKMR